MSYINKDATLAEIANKAKAELADVNHYFLEGVQLAVDVVEGMPEVQPERKRGRWIYSKEAIAFHPFGTYDCSVCGKKSEYYYNFCPYCGADMSEDDHE